MSLTERPEESLPPSSPAFGDVRAAFLSGKSRAARALLDEQRPVPACSADAALAAEVYAATGAMRRSDAILRWAAMRFGADDDVAALAAVRAALARGHERTAKVLLGDRPGRARDVLRARLTHSSVEPHADDDVDTAIDVVLAMSDPAAAVSAAMAVFTRAPSSSRARLVCARMMRASGKLDEGRILLKVAARAPLEDARIELASALALVADEIQDEASLATARARARHPDLAQDHELRLLLTLLAWSAGRRDDAAAVTAGASDLLLVERSAAVFLAGGPAPSAGSIRGAAPRRAGANEKKAKPGKKKPEFAVVDADGSVPAAWRRPLAIWMLVFCGIYFTFFTANQVLNVSHPAPTEEGTDQAVTAVDAGVDINDLKPRVDAAAFRTRAYACNVNVPPVVDIGLPFSRVIDGLAGKRFDERPFKPAREPVALDAELLGREDLRFITLGTGGRAEPALLVGHDLAAGGGGGDAVIGYALFPTTSTNRPALESVIDMTTVPLGEPSITPCPGSQLPGHEKPDASCFRAKAPCEGVDVIVRAVCPLDSVVKDAQALGACQLDAVLVTAR